MQVFSLLAIFFALLVAIFALQNAVPVEINFLVWQFRRISLVLVILGSAAFGALVVFLLGTVKQVRQARMIREMKSQQKRLQETIARLEAAPATPAVEKDLPAASPAEGVQPEGKPGA